LHAAVLDRGAGRLAGKKFLKTVALDRGTDLGTENVLLAAGQDRTAAEAALVDYQNPAGTDRRRVRGSAGEHEHRAAADDGITAFGVTGQHVVG
jgi:hypothetical protein